MFADVTPLRESVEFRWLWAGQSLSSIGRRLGDPKVQQWGIDANAYPPVLKTHDRQGRRIDVVEFHPAYHALMRRSIGNGLHSSVWENGPAETGKRHPVTRGLEGSASEPPRWSRFFRTVDTRNAIGAPVMTGADGKPLLLLSRFGEGRVSL